MKSEDALLYRWAAVLEDYDYVIKHRPGKSQGHVDGLSRLPINKVKIEQRKELHEQETEAVLRGIHKDTHLGLKKTLGMFHKKYTGKKTYATCERIIKECVGCQMGTDYRPRKFPAGHITSTRPWELFSIDVIGPCPGPKRDICLFSPPWIAFRDSMS